MKLKKSFDSPVEDVIVLETLGLKAIAKEVTDIPIVGLVPRIQRSRVVDVPSKLGRQQVLTKLFARQAYFLLFYELKLLVICCSL